MIIHNKTVWLATDKDGQQHIYLDKPMRCGETCWIPFKLTSIFSLGEGKFKNTWKDEPIKIQMSLKN